MKKLWKVMIEPAHYNFFVVGDDMVVVTATASGWIRKKNEENKAEYDERKGKTDYYISPPPTYNIKSIELHGLVIV